MLIKLLSLLLDMSKIEWQRCVFSSQKPVGPFQESCDTLSVEWMHTDKVQRLRFGVLFTSRDKQSANIAPLGCATPHAQ